MSISSINSNSTVHPALVSGSNAPSRPVADTPAAVQPPMETRTGSDTTGKKDSASKSDVDKAVQTLNEFTGMVAQDLVFTMDEDSGKTVVKVVDSTTQELLRQIPSEEALQIARSLDKMRGLLIHEKA